MAKPMDIMKIAIYFIDLETVQGIGNPVELIVDEYNWRQPFKLLNFDESLYQYYEYVIKVINIHWKNCMNSMDTVACGT